MHVKSLLWFLFLSVITILSGATFTNVQAKYTVTVTAGEFDRYETIISVTFPNKIAPGVYELKDKAGIITPIQVDEQNTGRFILQNLQAGTSKTFTLIPEPVLASSSQSGITYESDANTFAFKREDQPICSFYYRNNELPRGFDEKYQRAGYLHPVFSPSGIPLTNHLDPKMHPHHFGIWSAWTHTEFQGRTPDFWNIQDQTGRIDHADSLQTIWKGPVYGGLRSVNHFVDLIPSAPVIALNEEWEMRVYNITGTPAKQFNMFDLKLTQTVNTAQPLKLPQYHYGGLAFRGHQQWDDPENVSFLTSRGHNRSNGNATPARWVHIGGKVNGKQVGISILSHPSNFRAPQPVRIHPQIPYMVYAPVQLGDMTIKSGSPYVMRYRYVTYDGKPDVEQLNHLWNDYAYPPGVTVSVK